MPKKVLFYCEHCQKAVNMNTDICPYCGAIFSGIRCPACDYSGTSSDFEAGCPVCGYIQEGNSSGGGGARRRSVLSGGALSAIIITFLVGAIILSVWYKLLL